MSNLHPVFQDVLVSLGLPQHIPPDAPTELRLRAYIRDLQRHDWTFEHSSDQQVWRRGRDELKRLRAERDAIDPKATLWNRYCHPDYHEQGRA